MSLSGRRPDRILAGCTDAGDSILAVEGLIQVSGFQRPTADLETAAELAFEHLLGVKDDGLAAGGIDDMEVALAVAPSASDLDGMFAGFELMGESFGAEFLVVHEAGAFSEIELHIGLLLHDDVTKGTVINFIRVGFATDLAFDHGLVFVDELLAALDHSDAVGGILFGVGVATEVGTGDEAWGIAFGGGGLHILGIGDAHVDVQDCCDNDS